MSTFNPRAICEAVDPDFVDGACLTCGHGPADHIRHGISDAVALTLIWETLSGNEWNADVIDAVARVLELSGRPVADSDDYSDDYTPCSQCGAMGSEEDHTTDNADGACPDCQDIYGNTVQS